MKAKYTRWRKPSAVWSKLCVLGIPELIGIFINGFEKYPYEYTIYVKKEDDENTLFTCL